MLRCTEKELYCVIQTYFKGTNYTLQEVEDKLVSLRRNKTRDETIYR